MWRIPEFSVSGVKGRQKPPRKAEMLKMNKSERGHQHPVSIKVELLHHSMSGITLQWPFPLKRQVEGKSLSKISTENNRAGVGSSSFLICHRALHSARTTLLHWQPVSDTTLAMCNILLYFNYSNRWMQHTVTKSQTDCNDAWMWACRRDGNPLHAFAKLAKRNINNKFFFKLNFCAAKKYVCSSAPPPVHWPLCCPSAAPSIPSLPPLTSTTLSPNSTAKAILSNNLALCSCHLSSSCLLSAQIYISATTLKLSGTVVKG